MAQRCGVNILSITYVLPLAIKRPSLKSSRFSSICYCLINKSLSNRAHSIAQQMPNIKAKKNPVVIVKYTYDHKASCPAWHCSQSHTTLYMACATADLRRWLYLNPRRNHQLRTGV